tara:strand:- start:747 stop:899 length:153 start_codon:yes stop_codon:yes gene_type:complete
MVFHSTYLTESAYSYNRPKGGALYPLFMIVGWPVGMMMYGFLKLLKLLKI